MRVYCGLAAGEPTGTHDSDGWLTVAVVDDSGRLLDVCDIADDAAGYAELGALLAERSAGGSSVAVAADTDEHHVTLLMAAAGRALAIVDEELLTDYAERFADDESPEEMEAGPSERVAVGLARALQAGALDASSQAAPRELMALKPVLAAHAAVAAGRHSTAIALREVLRELYPAALRAYPDPAEPLPLAILDALPEPGLLGNTAAGRNRDNAVVAELTAAGVADANTITEAIAALRVAISETPRRTGIGKGTTTAIAATIREAVAAVRACDAAIAALVGLLGEKGTAAPAVHPVSPAPRVAAPETSRPSTVRRGRTGALPAAPVPLEPEPSDVDIVIAVPAARPAARTPTGRTTATRPAARPAPAPVPRPKAIPAPVEAAEAIEANVPPPPPGIKPFYPDDVQAPLPRGGRATRTNTAQFAAQQAAVQAQQAAAQQGASRGAMATHQANTAPQPQQPAPAPQMPPAHAAATRTPAGPPQRAAQAPQHAPVVEPPQAAPMPPAPPQYPAAPPAAVPTWSMEPAGGYSPIPGGGTYAYEQAPYAPQNGYAEGELPTAYPLSPQVGAPGSRDQWPLNPPSFDEDAIYARRNPAYAEPGIPHQRDARVAPPWQSDDLPPEPSLRIPEEPEPRTPALRLVGSDEARTARHAPQAPTDDDGDLLIFAQARSSAWFDWPSAETEEPAQPAYERPAWTEIDAGWSLAARVEENPETAGTTDVGLPRRVPQANLVPGAPLPPASHPSLRIVRDPAAMAAHTTGYFRGSRRGEEVRGYAVGGRPGRESGGGWDFSRDGWDTDTGYRSAAR